MKETEVEYDVLQIDINESGIIRHLYLKPAAMDATASIEDPGAVRDSDEGKQKVSKGRAVFVAGLPAQLDEVHLLRLFESFGEVRRAALHGTRTSAVVLFGSKKGYDAIFRAAKKGKVIPVQIQLPEGPHGLKAWVESHKAKKPGNMILQKSLDEWMESWEAEEERKKAEALASLEEDGWTVVQRHRGRKKNTDVASGTVVGGVAAAAAAAHAAKKRSRVSLDFYRFQQRDRRRTELMELREKFEEDKRRLAELKAARKFHPL